MNKIIASNTLEEVLRNELKRNIGIGMPYISSEQLARFINIFGVNNEPSTRIEQIQNDMTDFAQYTGEKKKIKIGNRFEMLPSFESLYNYKLTMLPDKDYKVEMMIYHD